MPLFQKREEVETPDMKDIEQELIQNQERIHFLELMSRSLLVFLKDFTLEIPEINSEHFKDEIDELIEHLTNEQKISRFDSKFEKEKKTILKHIEKQNQYVTEREKELKGIISYLSQVMAEMDEENQDFNDFVYAKTRKLEEITRLDDIKLIKSTLIQEVNNVKNKVHQKQEKERRRVDTLRKRVSTLNTQLEKAQKQSLTDGLTGVSNRQAFDSFIKGLIDKNTVMRMPFSLFIIDIDRFKNINDTYGHQIGDRILLALVLKCKDYIREQDFIARYGGDEFIVILPGASLRNATKRAKQISKSVSSSIYSLDDMKKGTKLSFTTSMGISAYRKGDTVQSIIERADQALYMVKDQGRDGVMSEKDVKKLEPAAVA